MGEYSAQELVMSGGGRKRFLFWITLAFLGLAAGLMLLSLDAIKNRAYRSQIILIAPTAVFTTWSWPLSGWRFDKIPLVFASNPDIQLKDVEGQIVPKLWNLLMGCSSGADITVRGIRMTLPSTTELILNLRTLFAELSWNTHRFHKYVCQSTLLSADNTRIDLDASGLETILIKKFSYKKTDSPMIQVDGVIQEDKPFGLTLTYRPIDDIVVFTADFLQQARFDGQVESFSNQRKSFLSGAVHCPAMRMTLGDKKSNALSAAGTFSLSGDVSGELSDLGAAFWAAESLMLDGALDARKGVLRPFNLPAEVFREVGQIPALTQLGKLIDERALPKLFDAQETPFELLRFMIGKEGSLIKLSRVVLKHSSYLAAGEGAIHPDTGTMSFTGSLVLSDDLSRRLLKNVPRLAILTSAGGRVSFPFKIEGSVKMPQVHADIPQITEKIISAYRTELVRRGNSRIEVLQ